MKQVLIFGPTSWDTVVKIDKYPENGGFAQGLLRDERAGGAGLNIAAAVSSARVETCLYSYVGTDEIGKDLKEQIDKLEINSDNVKELPGPSLHAIITIDAEGERTIFALEKNRFAELNFEITFSQNQIVVFPVWRDFYISYLEKANTAGAKTIVGMAAIANPNTTACYMIGSEKDFSDMKVDSGRFDTTIITSGAGGVRIFNSTDSRVIPVRPTKVVDATGAGDSFLSGVLVGLANQTSLESAVKTGINWAAAAISETGSVPPRWREEFSLA